MSMLKILLYSTHLMLVYSQKTVLYTTEFVPHISRSGTDMFGVSLSLIGRGR